MIALSGSLATHITRQPLQHVAVHINHTIYNCTIKCLISQPDDSGMMGRVIFVSREIQRVLKRNLYVHAKLCQVAQLAEASMHNGRNHNSTASTG
jgi:hypothetical protein